MEARRGHRSPKERRALVRTAAAHAVGDEPAFREALREAAATTEPRAIEEVLLQSYLFLGFPATIWGLGVWRSMTEEEVGGPAPDDGADPGTPSKTAPSAESERKRGEEICRTVYGTSYEKLRRNVRRLHPALDRWMIREGYGKVLGRPGLDLATRELCIVAVLGVTGREPQLHSHLRGALNAGAGPAEVEDALTRSLALSEIPGWSERALALWSRVAVRHVR